MTEAHPLKKRASAHANEMVRRSKLLFRLLDEAAAKKRKDRTRILVPTVSLAEFLCGVEERHHTQVMAEFQARFICPPFDLPATALAAQLWQFNHQLPQHERLQRRIVKSDMIMKATAKVAGATVFYSHDPACRNIAERAGLDARDLPTYSGNWIIDKETETGGEL